MKKQAFIFSLLNAAKGVVTTALGERNFKIQLVLMGIIISMGIGFSITPVQWIIIILCSGAVLSMELLNTAIEKLADAITTAYHPLIKQAKDAAAGAVLVLSVTSIIIYLIIFIPEIKRILL